MEYSKKRRALLARHKKVATMDDQTGLRRWWLRGRSHRRHTAAEAHCSGHLIQSATFIFADGPNLLESPAEVLNGSIIFPGIVAFLHPCGPYRGPYHRIHWLWKRFRKPAAAQEII
jgi:hypothetical protein